MQCLFLGWVMRQEQAFRSASLAPSLSGLAIHSSIHCSGKARAGNRGPQQTGGRTGNRRTSRLRFSRRTPCSLSEPPPVIELLAGRNPPRATQPSQAGGACPPRRLCAKHKGRWLLESSSNENPKLPLFTWRLSDVLRRTGLPDAPCCWGGPLLDLTVNVSVLYARLEIEIFRRREHLLGHNSLRMS